MDQELQQQSSNSDITAFSIATTKTPKSLSRMSVYSATPSRIDYVHGMSVLFHKIHQNLKLQESKCLFNIEPPNPKKNAEIFDWEAFVELLMRIFKELIEKLEFVFCLEIMLKDKNLIISHLGCANTEKLYSLLSTIKNKNPSTLQYDTIPPNFIEISKILLKTSSLMEESVRYKDQIAPNIQGFLQSFQEFYRLMKIKCNLAAPNEMFKDRTYQEMYKNNHRICDKIKEIEDSLKREEAKAESILLSKKAAVNVFRDQLCELKKCLVITQKEQNKSCQRELNQFCELSKVEQKQLVAKLNVARKKYNDILAENLKVADGLRERKWIVQQQLQGWLNRYDKDVGARAKDVEDLKYRLSLRKEEFDEWHVQFKLQERIHTVLMKKKEIEDERTHQYKVVMFRLNRAARIIQRWYRRFLAIRKKQRLKDLKKGKKGQKGRK